MISAGFVSQVRQIATASFIYATALFSFGVAANAEDPIVPAPFPDGEGIEFEDVSPRVGLTYALGDERKTLLRGSYARFAAQAYTTFAFADPDASLNPGAQTLDLGRDFGAGLELSAIFPLSDKVALGLGVQYDKTQLDIDRLINPGGTFVATTGSGDLESLTLEPTAMFLLRNGTTFNVSAVVGTAHRDAILNIGGVNALNFSDRTDVYGAGIGLGVPAELLGVKWPGVCFNAGVNYRKYGSANGLSPTNVPINIGSTEDIAVQFGVTIDLSSFVPSSGLEDDFGPVQEGAFCKY